MHSAPSMAGVWRRPGVTAETAPTWVLPHQEFAGRQARQNSGRRPLRRGAEEAQGVMPSRLGLTHGALGLAEQLFNEFSATSKQGDADARRHPATLFTERKNLVERSQHLVTDVLDMQRCLFDIPPPGLRRAARIHRRRSAPRYRPRARSRSGGWRLAAAIDRRRPAPGDR